MAKIPLVPVTFLTLLLTGLSLNQAGWFAARPSPSPRAEARARGQDSLAAWRHRQGQPGHWRAMLMMPR